MLDVKLTPQELDMQVLRLAAESHFGVSGRTLGTILSILRDRGATSEKIYEAVEILEEREWVSVRCYQPRVPKGQRLGYADTTVAITTKGKDALRQMESSTQFNIRVPKLLAQELHDYAEQARTTVSGAAIQFIQEGVRGAKFPGVDFRWTPTGRAPHVTGTGLSVWEMFAIWRDRKEDLARVREDYAHLTAAQIQAGVGYAKAYLHEMPVRPGKPNFVQELKVT